MNGEEISSIRNGNEDTEQSRNVIHCKYTLYLCILNCVHFLTLGVFSALTRGYTGKTTCIDYSTGSAIFNFTFVWFRPLGNLQCGKESIEFKKAV